MAIRPALRTAVAGNKIKASEYNDNFTDMLNYLDDVVDDMEDYVLSYMPEQLNNNGKFLSTNGLVASWTDIMPILADLPSSDVINGLIITKNSSSPTDTIDVSTGSCFDSTKAKILVLNTAKTKQNTSQAVNTTYYVYLLAKEDLSAYDILITTSSSSPSLPSGYTYYRQIGYYSTDGNGDIYYITNLSSSIEQSNKFVPDYEHGVSWAAGTHTATSDGIVVTAVSSGNTFTQSITVNGVELYRWVTGNSNGAFNAVGHAKVYSGDTVVISPNGTFYPMKGV